MSLRQFLFAVGKRAGEAATRRRLARIWLTTGAVPVAHIVADADDWDASTRLPRPAPRVKRRAVSRRVHPC
jgi:hypothetical protein